MTTALVNSGPPREGAEGGEGGGNLEAQLEKYPKIEQGPIKIGASITYNGRI